MKHVFVVHSHITHLISIVIAQQLQIQKNDVVIVSFDSEFSPSFQPFKIHYLLRKTGNNRLSQSVSWLKKFNYSKYLDNAIALLTNAEDFELYINYAYSSHRILMTNNHCVKFNFIEEGMDNYKNDDLLAFTVHSRSADFRVPFKKRIGSFFKQFWMVLQEFENVKLNLIPTHPACYSTVKDVRYYSFSEYAFHNVPDYKKQILDINLVLKYKGELSDVESLNNAIIWVGDNVVNFYKMPLGDYISAIKAGIETLTKTTEINKIYLKFHGRESQDGRDQTRWLFNDMGIETIVLEDSKSLELILLNSKNCTIAGLTSSLLWYAALMGHRSYSVNRYLTKHSHLEKDNIYWQKVLLL